jgi:hypothetical protein
MTDFLTLKHILDERRKDKNAIAYSLFFGGLFIGYLLAHVVVYLVMR